jgi:uncharacterized protein (DUF1697 family)
MKYVCLLRGINVGGNNIISMKKLKESFEKFGFTDVVTYINSGNIIFSTPIKDPRKLETGIEKLLQKDFKYNGKVVVRSFKEIEALIKSLPKNWKAEDASKKFNVIFLRHAIDSKIILDGLKPKEGIEEVIYKPGVLFWSANTSDLTKTAMVKLASQKIYQDVTVRNLNTTKKLHELMKGK